MALVDLLPGRNKEVAPAPTPVAKPAHRGILEIGGMFPLEWNTADQVSVERARHQFNSAIMAGYTAQSYRPGIIGFGGSRMDGEVTREFDPEADAIRMSLPYAGG